MVLMMESAVLGSININQCVPGRCLPRMLMFD